MNKEIIHRLHRVKGQIKAIEEMVENQESCQSIIQQILAVRSALASLGLEILKQELCYLGSKKREKAIEEYSKQAFKLH